MQIKTQKNFLILFIIIFGFDLLALTGGAAYLIHPAQYLFGNLYGYIILMALLGNIVLAYLGGFTAKTVSPVKAAPADKSMRRYLDYCYLLMHIISMLLIPILITLASSDAQNKTSQSIFVICLYNFIFLFGAANAGLQIRNYFINRKSNPEKPEQNQSGGRGNVMRWIAVVFLCLCLVIGFYFSYIILGKSTGNMIEVFIPEYAVFWGLQMLGVSLLINRLRWRNNRSVLNKIILAAGIIIFIICMVPLASIPVTIRNADAAYREAFGGSSLDDKTIDEKPGFMRHPFSLQDYFFGTRTFDYTVRENVLYYEGYYGKDAGIKLYFDAYMPLGDTELSAQNPVLIRIHGGAWTMGDKGFSNYAEVNKHFVNQGYVVFDIQYGLNDQNPSFASSASPSNVKGNFDIDDMVRHIGIFTSYLSDHAGGYNADLNSVFISGGSAGGQLAIAAALGITGGKYTDILDPRLHVIGLIPFYPANSLSPNVGIGGTPDLIDPAALVDEYSPPCLIYHGTHDGIVNPKYASILQNAYKEKSSAPCALLWMNFASHGSDFFTPGYYNQIFMYYMERFMNKYAPL